MNARLRRVIFSGALACAGLSWAHGQFSPLDGIEGSADRRARAEASSAPGRLPDLPPPPEAPKRTELVEEAPPAPKPQGEGLRFAEAPLYQVAGYDFASVQCVFQLAGVALRVMEPYVPMPENVPLPLLIQLVPASAENRSGPPYWMAVGAHNNVTLSLRWDENTSLRDTCEAVAAGLLKQSFLNAYGPERGQVPRWIAAAFGVQTYVRLQGVRMDLLQEESAAWGPLPLRTIFDGNAPDARRFADDAFWLFRTISQASPDRQTLKRRLERFTLETDPFLVLRECVPQSGATPADAQLWWSVTRQVRVAETPPRVWSIPQSREFMAQSVLIPARVDGKDLLLTAPELWPYRATPEVKVAAIERMRLMRMKTNMINPVYFNAAVSFSETMEALVEGREKLLAETYARFSKDLANALALEEAIEKALDLPLGPVGAAPATSPKTAAAEKTDKTPHK